MALIAVNVAVYVIAGLLSGNVMGQPTWLILNGGLIPSVVEAGQWWRLLTSMFLHAGIAHIAVNMIALYIFGSFTEEMLGRARFLVLYFVGGIAGGVAYLYFGNFDIPAVGASGAIFALPGAILGFSLRRGTFSMQNPIIMQILVILAINLWIGFTIPTVSNEAHIGGLVGGFVFGALVATTVYSLKRRAIVIPALVGLGIEAALALLWLLYFAGRPLL